MNGPEPTGLCPKSSPNCSTAAGETMPMMVLLVKNGAYGSLKLKTAVVASGTSTDSSVSTNDLYGAAISGSRIRS
jgi:thiamine pyrophosphate-dependent acetolactate synthase large subunit-like protein